MTERNQAVLLLRIACRQTRLFIYVKASFSLGSRNEQILPEVESEFYSKGGVQNTKVAGLRSTYYDIFGVN